jgi:hypothetical protein
LLRCSLLRCSLLRCMVRVDDEVLGRWFLFEKGSDEASVPATAAQRLRARGGGELYLCLSTFNLFW